MPLTPFPQWVAEQTGYDLERLEPLRLAEAFDVAVTRAEEARLRGAVDPLSVIMNAVAGGNSRAVTRRMLARIGYVDARLRLMLRLLGGSKSGWRGLAKAYSDFANPAIDDAGLTPAERDYARRQIRTFLAVDSRPRSGPQGLDRPMSRQRLDAVGRRDGGHRGECDSLT